MRSFFYVVVSKVWLPCLCFLGISISGKILFTLSLTGHVPSSRRTLHERVFNHDSICEVVLFCAHYLTALFARERYTSYGVWKLSGAEREISAFLEPW